VTTAAAVSSHDVSIPRMCAAAMFRRLRAHHALSWSAIGLGGLVLGAACLQPAFELRIGAFVGAGSTQRSFDYAHRLTVAGSSWRGALLVVAGLAFVAAAAVGVARGSRAWLVLGSAALAVALLALAIDTQGRLDWADGAGVIGYESPHGGPLLQPALDELKADARRSPEARDPSWTLTGGEHGYAGRGLRGWKIVLSASVVLAWLTGYRVARLRLGRWASVGLVAGLTFATLVWLVLRSLGGLE
jgi:hypothetical protein